MVCNSCCVSLLVRKIKCFGSRIPFVGALGLRVLLVPRGGLFWRCSGGTLVLPAPRGDTVSLAVPRGDTMIRRCLARVI
jgi:hypothetical protein